MTQICFGTSLCVLILALGCQKDGTSGSDAQPAALPGRSVAAALRVLVVDDQPLAEGLKLLRGEWKVRSGGPLELEQWSAEQLLEAEALEADLIIFPSRYLGTLVDRDWLRPVRESVLQSEDLARDKMLANIRNAVLPYGGEVYALSLGEAPLMLSGAVENMPDALSTWENAGWRLDPKKSPLPYPRAAELLVRGVAYEQRRGQIGVLFDSETMQPSIADPPFLRALQEIVEWQRDSPESAPKLALSWPTAARETESDSISFAPLPSATVAYDPLRASWEKREAIEAIVFLGFAGRSVGVSTSTRNSSSAFKLMQWLVSEGIAIQLSPRSEATAWFRTPQAAQARKWLPKSSQSEATASTVSALLAAEHYFLLPRIPGIDEYLQTLDEAVSRAISGELPPEAALLMAVQDWNRLTDRQGRNRQRAAYRKHLGLE